MRDDTKQLIYALRNEVRALDSTVDKLTARVRQLEDKLGLTPPAPVEVADHVVEALLLRETQKGKT